MALNTDSIKNATNLIQQTKPVLAKIAAALGKSDATYLKLSAKVADAAQHNIIEEVNAAQEDAQHAQQKIEAVNRKFGRNMNDVSAFMAQQLVIEKYKTLLEEAWTATNLLATLDMPQEFKDLRYLPNRQSLKELCAQLGVSTYIASPISTSPTTVKPTISSPTKNEDTPVLLKWVVGIVFFLGLVFAIWGKEGFGVLFAICAFTVVVIRPFIKNPGCGVMIICTGLGAFMGGIYAIPGGALGIGFLGFVIGGIIAMKFFEGKY